MELSGLAAGFYNDGVEATQHKNAERMLMEGMEPALIARLLAIPVDRVESIKAKLRQSECV